MTRDAKPRERRRGAPPAIRVVEGAETVFRAAIGAGVLSAEPAARAYAGYHLYMFHDGNGTAWFKHRDTRAYVSMSARHCAAGYVG